MIDVRTVVAAVISVGAFSASVSDAELNSPDITTGICSVKPSRPPLSYASSKLETPSNSLVKPPDNF